MRQTLIVLHGWGQDKSNWRVILDKLEEKGVHCVCIDLPGFGEEKLVSSTWGIPEYSVWVKEKIDSLSLDNIVLLGHSFGGRIASYIAAENPSWLKGLILYGAPCIYRPSLKVKVKIFAYKTLKKLGLRAKSKNIELNLADEKGLGQVFRKVVSFDQTNILPSIKVKTTLIWGEKDTEVPLAIAQEIKRLIPNSDLLVLKALGHNAHIENNSLFTGKIIQIIDSIC